PTVLIWLAADVLFLPYPLGLDTATSRSGLLVMLIKPILPEPAYADATFSIGTNLTLNVHGAAVRSYTSPLWQALMIFGFFLLAGLVYMLVREWEYCRLKGQSLLRPFGLFAQVYVILLLDLWARKELDFVIKGTNFHFLTFVRVLFVLAAIGFMGSGLAMMGRHLLRGGRVRLGALLFTVLNIAVMAFAYVAINIRTEWFFTSVGKLFSFAAGWKAPGALNTFVEPIANIARLAHASNFKVDYALALLLVPFVIGLLRSLCYSEFSPGDQLAALLLFVGFGIVLGDEIVYLADFLAGGDWCRMNSVFKFHFQAVVLLSLGISIGLCYLKVRIARLLGLVTSGRRLTHLFHLLFGVAVMAWFFSWISAMWLGIVAAVWLLVLLAAWLRRILAGRLALRHLVLTMGLDGFDFLIIVLLVLGLIFPFAGTYEKIKERSNGRAKLPTLNGIAFKKKVNPEEYEAIEWLNRNIDGHPVILETTGPSYQEYSRISMNTGLPTVLGWGSHVVARGFSWKEIINDRGQGLDLIYDTTDIKEALKIIRKYDVAYIYVGHLERKRHEPEGLAKFDRYKNVFNLIFSNPKVKIYEVRGHRFWKTAVTEEEEDGQDVGKEMELAISGNMLVGGKGDKTGQFSGARGLAVDRSGNLFVADPGNHRVQKFDPNGAFVTLWEPAAGAVDTPFLPWAVTALDDGRVAVADRGRNAVWYLRPTDGSPRLLIDRDAGLSDPRGITAAGASIYIADAGNGRIVETDLSGHRKAVIGSRGIEPGTFLKPTGIAVSDAYLYVADAQQRRIHVFDHNGRLVKYWPFQDETGGIIEDVSLALDERGNVLVTTPGRGGFLVFSPDGVDITKSLAMDTDGFAAPAGIAAHERTIYVSDAMGNRIQRFVLQPPPSIYKGGDGTRPGQFKVPRDIDIDSEGNIYVVDFQNYRIQKFDSRGELVLLWGEQGNELKQFKDPCGIAVYDGKVYVADTWNNRIQVFHANGDWLSSFDGGAGGFFAPRGITIDDSGRVYVCDTGNGRIQIFNSEGLFIRAIASKGSGDNQLHEPCGITLDAARRIYVADSGNHRVQIFGFDGGLIRSIPIPELEGPVQEPYIEFDREDGFYLTIPNSNKVLHYSSDGTRLGEADKTPEHNFSSPTGLAMAPNGDIVVMDMNSPRAWRLTRRHFK
ncbi:hypothetical protein JW905_11585, partial [bacterium]|nr:hypothetical protein [candidate division CSSED10-310 bacterium]